MTLRTYLYSAGLLLGLGLISCQRQYEAPEQLQKPRPIDAAGLQLSQEQLQKHIQDYILGQQFALARQELELLSDHQLQDSLRSVLERTEAFADAHLIYAVDDQQRKVYLGGKERIAYYLEHGYLSSPEDPTGLNFVLRSQDSPEDYSQGIALPETTTQLYNLARYTTLSELRISTGRLERLDLRGLRQLRTLELRHAKDGLEVDLSESPQIEEIRLKKTPNLRLRLAPTARPRIIVQDSYFASLAGLQVEQAQSLILERVRLRDVELLAKVSPSLRRLDISIEEGDLRGADGYTYHPLHFDEAFVRALGDKLPRLEQLSLLFASRSALDKLSLEELQLPELRRLELKYRPAQAYIPRSAWGKRFRLELAHCPRLESLTLGALYYDEVDLSPLDEQHQARLQQLNCYGALGTLHTPSVHHRYSLKLNLAELSQIQVPTSARLQATLELLDYSSSRNEDGSPSVMNPIGLLQLDAAALYRDFHSISGFVIPLPPSRYQPRGQESTLRFSGTVWDFSGAQWQGFQGLISASAIQGTETLPLEYIDFGTLTEANFLEKVIQVAPGCIVKHRPEGIRVVEREITNY